MAKLAKKLQDQVSLLCGLVRGIGTWNTDVCNAFKKNGKPFAAVQGGEKNLSYILSASKGKDFTAHGRIFWVHSFYAPLAVPKADKEGTLLLTSIPSLKVSWDMLQKSGEVTEDFRAVSDRAVTEGILKQTWVKDKRGRSSLMYAVAADLPPLEKNAAKRSTSAVTATDVLKMARANRAK